MEDDVWTSAADFCADRSAATWVIYWEARRAERPRRRRGAFWLDLYPVAARDRAAQWHATALLIGGGPGHTHRQRRPLNRNKSEARRRMARAPGVPGPDRRRIRRNGQTKGLTASGFPVAEQRGHSMPED